LAVAKFGSAAVRLVARYIDPWCGSIASEWRVELLV
jgi:hypothetical protein